MALHLPGMTPITTAGAIEPFVIASASLNELMSDNESLRLWSVLKRATFLNGQRKATHPESDLLRP